MHRSRAQRVKSMACLLFAALLSSLLLGVATYLLAPPLQRALNLGDDLSAMWTFFRRVLPGIILAEYLFIVAGLFVYARRSSCCAVVDAIPAAVILTIVAVGSLVWLFMMSVATA